MLADIGGRAVAGLGGMPGGMEHPPVWTTYLATDDAAATAAQITAAGGQVVAPPMDVMDLGVMAIAQDPTGATFGIWQSKSHTGVELANDTGTLTWNELMTRDYAAAKDFYATVFGYTYADMGADGFEYSVIEVDGNTVGGLGGCRPRCRPRCRRTGACTSRSTTPTPPSRRSLGRAARCCARPRTCHTAGTPTWPTRRVRRSRSSSPLCRADRSRCRRE